MEWMDQWNNIESAAITKQTKMSIANSLRTLPLQLLMVMLRPLSLNDCTRPNIDHEVKGSMVAVTIPISLISMIMIAYAIDFEGIVHDSSGGDEMISRVWFESHNDDTEAKIGNSDALSLLYHHHQWLRVYDCYLYLSSRRSYVRSLMVSVH
jgi:hypothetical protein